MDEEAADHLLLDILVTNPRDTAGVGARNARARESTASGRRAVRSGLDRHTGRAEEGAPKTSLSFARPGWLSPAPRYVEERSLRGLARRGVRGAGSYGWYFSSTVSAPPDLGFMVTRTVTLLVFAAVSSWSTVHFDVP